MENLLEVVEQFLSLSDEKLEELATKKPFITITRRKRREECVSS